jgi:FkbM family methyltransferase
MNGTGQRHGTNTGFSRNRHLSTWLRGAFDPRQYRGVVAAARICTHPVDLLRRYSGAPSPYPASVSLRTPAGTISLNLYTWHDARTVHEIFLAEDYRVENSKSVIVDYGSNIGVSAAYFLSRNQDSFAYLFEPVPRNVDRLRENLGQFEGRYEIQQVAVGLNNGKVEFGVEETGRYGGIHRDTGQCIEVECRDSNQILSEIISKHGAIDILKIDVETMERALTERLTTELVSKINLLFVEAPFTTNPLASTHKMSRQGTVTRFQLSATNRI